MGFFDSIKDLYYQAEEKYYSVLDAIDEKIPIYKIIDPIDKVVPSFALLIALVFLLLVAGVVYFSGILQPTGTTLLFVVKDSDDGLISGAQIRVTIDGETQTLTSNDAGEAQIANLALDTVVSVQASKDGFQTRNIDTIISEYPAQVQEILLLEESLGFVTKTIRVVDEDGSGIRENLLLSFRCSSPYAVAPDNINLSASDNGVAEVTVPTNCERLIVSVSDDAEFESSSSNEFAVDERDATIVLLASQFDDGGINASLVDIDGTRITEEIRVMLFRYEESLSNPLIGPVDSTTTSSGSASFDAPPGTYVVKTTATPLFSAAESGVIMISAGETESVELTLEENQVTGTISVRIIDSASRQGIANATVTLKEESSGAVVEVKKTETDSDGQLEFDVSRDISYKVTAEASGYELAERLGIRISDSTVEIELDPCTPSTCGSLNVKVVDQDKENIENATVALYDADTGFLAGFANKTSDANGEAVFDAVPSGSYYAFSFKGTVQGRSDTKFFSTSSDSDEPDLVVTMVIPNGVVKATIVDKEGTAIPFSVVSVFDARNNGLLGSAFANADGVFELETKADKRVYLKVSQKSTSPQYADYTTIEKPIIGQSVQEFKVTLEPEIIGKNIELEFLGLFVDSLEATVLSVGEKYTARFRLRVPEEKNYSEAGMHLRTGTEIIMEKDPLFLKKINAPTASEIRATKFDASSNLAEQGYQLTNSDAKWANLVWTRPTAGIYEVEAEVQVKETASVQEQLKLFWRAWAQDGVRERHPADSTITVELYSEAFSRIYEVGVTTLCDESFCFSARIRDKTEGITESVVESYNAKNLQEYELRFSILNNSETRIHNSANLRVNNPEENLLFTDYSVIDAQTRETKGVLNANDFPRFDVGALDPKNKVDFSTSFFTQLNGSATVNIRLVSDESIVFEKNILVNVAATRKMEALVQPSFLASGIETDVNVLVLDATTKLEITGAAIRLQDRHDNIIFTTETGKDGYAHITVPSQQPGTKLFLEIEKPEYETLTVELTINGDLVELNPKELGFLLNAKTKFEDSQTLNLSNLTHLPLVIKEIKLKGNFRNLIDTTGSQSLLDFAYKDLVVDGLESKELKATVILSEEGKTVSNRQDLEGEINIVVENFGKQWFYSVPVKIVIGLEGEVDDPNCLQISRKEWVTQSEGDAVRTEVQIENNCIINSQPIELKKFMGQVQWESNELGIFDVTIGENKTELRSGYNKTMLSRLRPEETLTLLITFTPFGGVNGEAKAKLLFSASNPGLEQDQELSNELTAKITVVNLKQCISIEPATILIDKTELEKSFKINVGTGNVKCGVPVDFELSSPLDLDNVKFSVPDGSTKEVFVFRGDPLAGDIIQGQYPIYVKGKFGTQQAKQFLQTVRVRIMEEGCIQLSRYEFDVYKDPNAEEGTTGFDTAVLTNECFDKQVPIRVNTKSLTDAMKSGSTWGLLAFGISVLGHGLDSIFPSSGSTGGGGNNSNLDPTQGLSQDQIRQGSLFINGKDYFNKGNQWYIKDGSQWKQTIDPRPNQTTNRGTGNVVLGSGTGLFTLLPKGNLQKTFEVAQVVSPADARILSPTGLQAAGGGGLFGGGGMTGGIFGAATSVMDGITGTKNPLMQGLQAFMIASLVDYLGQEEEARFITTQRDVEIDVIAIQEPGQELEGLEKFVARGVATHVLERKILDKIPDSFRFLAPLVLSKNVNLLAPDFDPDIQVLQEVRPAFKALPNEGLDPALSSALFGGRDDQSIPAVSLAGVLGERSRRLERRGIVFINKSSFETQPEEPRYKVLRVMGIRHFYKDKKYSKDDFEIENKKGWFSFGGGDEIIDPTTGELEELPSELVDERFHLEFNAVPPETLPQCPGPECPSQLLNCQDGFRVGSTGAQALPKIKLGWKWGDIEADSCDTENEDGIFCDATQFSIAVLKKIENLRTFLENNAPFECPSPLDFRSNTSVIPNLDVGISEIALDKAQKDAKITVTVKNTNPQPISTKVEIVLKNAGTGEKVQGQECTQTVSVLSEEKAECEFSGLENANYAAEATITPTVDCQSCEDKAASNFLNINFTIGETGLEECEPFSTSRLEDFLAASGISGDAATGVLKNVRFQANLIQDRYSQDFQKDFDLHSKNETFFEAPQSYTEQATGLGNYFRDRELFSFKPSFGEAEPEGYLLPGAGKYNILVDITFEDPTWKLFDEKGTNAAIKVEIEKAGTPDEPNPFYVLPFDGTLGSDGRTNYGLNFEGSVVQINASTQAGSVKTLQIPNSVPLKELTVQTNESFKRLNTDERGVVLQVFGGEAPKLVFSPSYATPVILKMSNSEGEAWAFYSVEVNKGAVDTGPQMSRWNGIGFNCKAFDDRFMSEFFFTPDTHGLDEARSCARVPGELERTSYGFEYCEPVRFGNMFMKTVFYSPQETTTVLKMNVAQEQAGFITPSTEGTIVALDNKVLGGNIASVQDVFELVENEFVCVSSEEGKIDFWWNPKKVMELLQEQEDKAINECILQE